MPLPEKKTSEKKPCNFHPLTFHEIEKHLHFSSWSLSSVCLEDADDNRYQDRAAARRDMKGEYDALAAAGLRVAPM